MSMSSLDPWPDGHQKKHDAQRNLGSPPKTCTYCTDCANPDSSDRIWIISVPLRHYYHLIIILITLSCAGCIITAASRPNIWNGSIVGSQNEAHRGNLQPDSARYRLRRCTYLSHVSGRLQPSKAQVGGSQWILVCPTWRHMGCSWEGPFYGPTVALSQTAVLTLQDTGVFPSILLKFRRESNVSLLVAEVAIT